MSREVVFVVDSDARAAAGVADHLATLGFEPKVLEGTEACLSALAQREPLALLVSLQLEGGSGHECCQRIKENYAWRHLPIIVMTQTGQAHELMYCWRAAASDFLPRPITAEKLAPKLKVVSDAARPAADPSLTGRWVLLLETSRFYRNAIAGNLEHAGLHVVVADEPAAAIDLAEEHADKLDACLIGLPSISGALELCESLRKAAPRAAGKMLVLSPKAVVEEDLQKKVRALTGCDPLNKRELPFDLVLSKIFSHLKPANVLELRSSERMPYFSVVEFSADGKSWGCGFSYDVSLGGIFIRTLTPVPSGQQVTLRMDFVGQTVISKGVVAWANPFQPRVTYTSPVGMGVRLTEAGARLAEQIAGLRASATLR